MSELNIYSASAGSGKTYTLTREYVRQLFANQYFYKNILAVTFTNKAAAEMKHRILDELFDISQGKNTSILQNIQQGKPGEKIKDPKEAALSVLSNILNDYSHFSVGTIDSFFQRVFRNFTREIGVQANFNLYVDHSDILQSTIDELIDKLNDNEELKQWLAHFIESSIEEEKQINLQKSITVLSENLFKEKYKLLPDDIKSRISDKKTIRQLIKQLRGSTDDFLNTYSSLAEKCVALFERRGIDAQDFLGKNRGVGCFLKNIAEGKLKDAAGNIKGPSDTLRNNIKEDKWYSKSCEKAQAIDNALTDGLKNGINTLLQHYDDNISSYYEAVIILKDIYMSAILGDVDKALRNNIKETNSFILSDTGDLLKKVIGDDRAPFVYEKIGSEYNAFMIDEFQDTSNTQYDNFKTLLQNSLAQEEYDLVVGDVKQSIYRWRNTDWSIFGKQLERDFPSVRTSLSTNWRSLPNIIKFNNAVFGVLPEIVDGDLSEKKITAPFKISDVYSDVCQNIPPEKTGGYVKMSVFNGADEHVGKNILQKLTQTVKKCQDDGYSASDICILVRKNSEGIEVMNHLLKEKAEMSLEDKRKYNFEIVSNETLKVGNSIFVRFVVAVMKRILSEDDILNRCEMLHFFMQIKNRHDNRAFISLDKSEDSLYPAGFKKFLDNSSNYSLFDLSEAVISFFNINDQSDVAALNYFQDQILDYMNSNTSDIRGFVEWWQTNGADKSVSIAGEQDAIRIYTIHKSKGLQYKVVIMPFISWNFGLRNDYRIWVKSEKPPLDKAGAFSVTCSSKLLKTSFKDEYCNEITSSCLDNLNLMYVAFTRAEERLYGFAVNSDKNRAGNILKRGLDAVNADKRCGLKVDKDPEDPDIEIFEIGTVSERRDEFGKQKTTDRNIVESVYNIYSNNDRLRLKLNGESLVKDKYSKVYYGAVLHDILSRIEHRSDFENVVKTARLEGLLSDDDYEQAFSLIKNMLEREEMKKYFDDDAVVMTEPEILTGDGDIRRPDRLVFNGNRVTVIDYKFGGKRSEYKSQISSYCKLLTSMKYEIEAACLWYVESGEIDKI